MHWIITQEISIAVCLLKHVFQFIGQLSRITYKVLILESYNFVVSY